MKLKFICLVVRFYDYKTEKKNENKNKNKTLKKVKAKKATTLSVTNNYPTRPASQTIQPNRTESTKQLYPAIQPTAIAATVYRQREDQWAHAPIDIYDNRKDDDDDYNDEKLYYIYEYLRSLYFFIVIIIIITIMMIIIANGGAFSCTHGFLLITQHDYV